MNTQIRTTNDLLNFIVEKLDIPKSLYEKAAARHRSLGEWLCREASAVKDFDPDVRPQGSFRYGTVNRPLDEDEEYDLDNVCVLKNLSKSHLTQRELKDLYGKEIRAYAEANGMLKPVKECRRCWRLYYSDEVNFHLDTLPCVPEDQHVIARIVQLGTSAELARRCVAITDDRHPEYDEISQYWLSSNPRGFAAWFESRCELARAELSANREIRATVEDVPPYEWKTPLQRSIQVLKRHRDVMFKENPELAPISMIITNLAARSYSGETNLLEAITNIVNGMPDHIRETAPRVPNPADPAEDYADKWSKDARLEKSFWEWHHAVKSDLARLPALLQAGLLQTKVESIFEISIPDSAIPKTVRISKAPAVISAPATVISNAHKPWGK
jgi:hypothetical protein